MKIRANSARKFGKADHLLSGFLEQKRDIGGGFRNRTSGISHHETVGATDGATGFSANDKLREDQPVMTAIQ